MRKTLLLLCGLILVSLMPSLLTGCGCGFSCSGSNNNGDNDKASLTLGFATIPPEDLKEVFIKIKSMTFRRPGADDVVVDNFTVSELDLLKYPGDMQLVVIENKRFEPGLYTEVWIDVVDNNVNDSYVLDSEDNQLPLNVQDSRLVLEDLQLEAGSQVFTIMFGLAQSIQFVDESSDYLLTENGIRIEDNDVDAVLSGRVDSELFSSGSCSENDPEKGNRVYLYEGGRSESVLVDIYLSGSTNKPDPGSVAPFAVASLAETESGDWEYTFGYLPPDNYTLAFSCNSLVDDPVEWDELDIPLPDNEIYQLLLSESESAVCNLPINNTSSCPIAN